MKSKILLILTALLIFSCNSSDNENNIKNEPVIGKWNLSKILNGSIGGESNPTTNNMHYYLFKSNGEFERVETKDNIVTKHTGTFNITDQHDLYKNLDSNYAYYIELTYTKKELKFFNCSADYENQQLLILNSSNELINNLPMACDGNGYKYTK